MKKPGLVGSGVLAAMVIGLAGCGSTDLSTSRPTASTTSRSSVAPVGATDSGPLATSRMICGPEIRGVVGRLFATTPAPRGSSTWVDQLFTCTYQVPAGSLVLSVKESADQAAAFSYFRSLRARLGTTHPLLGLEGLGLPAYEASNGTVVFLKDGSTLVVDASRVMDTTTQQYTSRTDLAYEVASDVIGCWSED